MAKRKRHTRRISREVRETFGLPTARRFKVPKNRRGTGKVRTVVSGASFIDAGSTYVAVLTQADLIAPSEVSYYAKRAADIARRWLNKSFKHRVSVELVTLFAKQSLDAELQDDDIVIGPRYMHPTDEDIPDVGDDWEYRNMYRQAPGESASDASAKVRLLLRRAREKTGTQDNDLDFLATFIIAIRVRKWTVS